MKSVWGKLYFRTKLYETSNDSLRLTKNHQQTVRHCDCEKLSYLQTTL